MFLRRDLDELVAAEAKPAVSIYLPTHTAGREIRQDPIRLRNLVARAQEQLEREMRATEAAALLEPAQTIALPPDQGFWRHQDQGLALFLAPGFSRIHKVQIPLPEEVFVGPHFHIGPLLPVAEAAGAFWLLAIGAHTRLYQGNRWMLAPVTGIELPQAVSPRPSPEAVADQYAAGQDAAETGEAGPRKEEPKALVTRIAAAIEPVLKGSPGPLVLAGLPEIQGHFREAARWPELLPEGVAQNPDALSEGELQALARPLVEPLRRRAREDALQRLHARLGTGDAPASLDPEEIVKAARYARIDTLFLVPSERLWGRFEEAEDRVIVQDNPGEGAEDLFNFAALMTLRQGGRVIPVERGAAARRRGRRGAPAVLSSEEKRTMQTPLEIVFHNMAPSADIEAEIRQHVDKLERFYDRMIGCRVSVELLHRQHRTGNLFEVHVEMRLPGGEIAVTREPHRARERYADPDLHVSLRDAFKTAERRLIEFKRKQSGEVKVHEEPFAGQVSQLYPAEDHGFLLTHEGTQLYFHRNSLIQGDFDKLQRGDRVHFVQIDGDTGPIASKVWPAGAPG